LKRCGNQAGSAAVEWTEPMLEAVAAAKAAVAAATHLAHPVVGAQLCLMVDASADHVGNETATHGNP
jgi:hypothetical protein